MRKQLTREALPYLRVRRVLLQSAISRHASLSWRLATGGIVCVLNFHTAGRDKHAHWAIDPAAAATAGLDVISVSKALHCGIQRGRSRRATTLAAQEPVDVRRKERPVEELFSSVS